MISVWALFDCAVVLAFMLEGVWLERINGVHGVIDKFFTPLPLGLLGLCIVFLQRHGA